jgi:hypothetical protein
MKDAATAAHPRFFNYNASKTYLPFFVYSTYSTLHAGAGVNLSTTVASTFAVVMDFEDLFYVVFLFRHRGIKKMNKTIFFLYF